MANSLLIGIDQKEEKLDLFRALDSDGLVLLDRTSDASWWFWIDQFTDFLFDSGQVTLNTIHHYGHDVHLFMRYLATFERHLASPLHADGPVVEAFLQYMTDVRGNRPASIRRRLSSLNRFFDYLLSLGIVETNPVDGVEKTPHRPSSPAILSRAQAQRFLHAAQTTRFPLRDHAIFQLFLSCGCTLSELLDLDVSDYNPDEATITFTGRRGSRRTVPLSRSCRRALSAYVAARPKAPSDRGLFLNRHGRRITKGAVYHAFRLILSRARIDEPRVTVHTLRHTCFTLMWKAGTSMFRLQQIAGHASLSTTKMYTRRVKRPRLLRPVPLAFPLDEV